MKQPKIIFTLKEFLSSIDGLEEWQDVELEYLNFLKKHYPKQYKRIKENNNEKRSDSKNNRFNKNW